MTMRYKSLIVGLFMIVGSNKIGNLLSLKYGIHISMLLMLAGIVVFVYSISLFIDDFKITEKDKIEILLKSIMDQSEGLATKENQIEFIQKQGLFIEKQNLILEHQKLLIDNQKKTAQNLDNFKNEIAILMKGNAEDILEKIDVLSKTVQYAGINDVDRQVINNIAGREEQTSLMIGELQPFLKEEKEEFITVIREISERQENLKNLPQIFCQSIDDLIENDIKSKEVITERICELNSAISDQYQELTEKFKKAIRQVNEMIEDYDLNICQKLEQLSGQYEAFQSHSEEMIKQMCLMGKQDLEIIKEIMGDANEKLCDSKDGDSI